MNLKDLIKLIETCGKNGVTQLKIGEIEVLFDEKQRHNIDYLTHNDTINVDSNSDYEEESPLSKELSDIELEELKLSDPIAYEKYITDADEL